VAPPKGPVNTWLTSILEVLDVGRADGTPTGGTFIQAVGDALRDDRDFTAMVERLPRRHK
jgi:hypothetical protein